MRHGIYVFIAMLALSCRGRSKNDQKELQAIEGQALPADVSEIPLDPKTPDDPSRLPKMKPSTDVEVAARHILVSYRDAKDGKAARSKAVAKQRALRLVQAARKKNADFVQLAQKFSDGPKPERGKIEFLTALDTEEAVFQAARSIGVQQISDPLDTPAGFYILERVEPDEYSSAHILIMYKGAKLAPPGLKRSEEEAQKKAEGIARRAKRDPKTFGVLAGRYSDSPSRTRGGIIAPIQKEGLLEGFEPYFEAVKALGVGEISEVVKTPYGFHVIKRLKLTKILARHILIAHDDGETQPKSPRSQRDAKKLVVQLRNQLLTKEKTFEELAKEHSDDASAERGGMLSPFARGETVPNFEKSAFSLGSNELSEIVETPFGFHIIQRL